VGAFFFVEIVSIEDPLPLRVNVTLVGFRLALPAGIVSVDVRDIVPEKPFRLDNDIVAVPLDP
jgi:hypothetical protein